MHRHLLAIQTLVVLVALGCSADPDTPGVCSLSCSDAKIGSRQHFITLDRGNPAPSAGGGTDQTIDIGCPANLQTSESAGLYWFQWTILKEKTNPDADSEFIPVPNVSVTPVLLGPRSNIESSAVGNTGLYDGVATDRSEWCSDSCGVATVVVEPVCLAGGVTTELHVSLRSGSSSSIDNITISTGASEGGSSSGSLSGHNGKTTTTTTTTTSGQSSSLTGP